MTLAYEILDSLRRHWRGVTIIILAALAWHFHARAVANANALRTQAAQYRQAQDEACLLYTSDAADE